MEAWCCSTAHLDYDDHDRKIAKLICQISKPMAAPEAERPGQGGCGRRITF